MKVRFHLPDFSDHFKLNLVFAAMVKNCPQFMREGVEIASFYGAFPQSLWNGGRTGAGVYSKSFAKKVLNSFNSQGIPLRFTFTNPMLTEEHLNDEFCNSIMKMADNGLNEVIVNSPILEEYIRKNYPNYKLTSSTCKRITDIERLKEEMEKDYNIVVIDYDFNNQFDLLEKIPHKEKCEILVNACCDPGCKRRIEHYRAIGTQQIMFCEHLEKYPNRAFRIEEHPELPSFQCDCPNRSIFEIQNLRTHISPDAIWEKYVPMGFNQFKIEGRTATRLNLIETYLYYMVKPKCRDEARFMFLYNLEHNGVIKIDG
jgi:hypothetical protein rflaF_15027